MTPRWAAVTAVALFAAGAAACGSDGGGDVAAFCDAASDTARFEAVFDDLDPGDVDAAILTFETALTAQRELRVDAPSEVRADVDVSIAFLEDLIAGLRATDPDGGRPAVYAELRPRFDEVEAAGDRLSRWVDANC